ncbi:hypothetical protein HCQ94_04715 [Actinomyces sp. zg-332]|uniref:hypothetical protein n=1 Tax=Actinomyces sp. zg-332 TaxID=2708340 RepID=UPI0014223105|nr:hypothetical protein [Actinomyces sp. zg-332]QPK93888.1 hypothetical protein HCQ94_04715 [Actinomyces sp. zg-332]
MFYNGKWANLYKYRNRNALAYHEITELEKRIICSWKYYGKYAISNETPYEE